MDKVKIISVSLTEDQHDKAKKLALDTLGQANVSGYYAFLINEKWKERV